MRIKNVLDNGRKKENQLHKVNSSTNIYNNLSMHRLLLCPVIISMYYRILK